MNPLGNRDDQRKLVIVCFQTSFGGVMRRDHRMVVALLAGSLSLAGLVAAAQLLDAAELSPVSQRQLTQQVQPQGQTQPGPLPASSAPAEPRSPPAETPVPSQPAGNSA